MNRRHLHRTPPGLLFAATGIVFAISLCLPAFQFPSTSVVRGYIAFLTTFSMTFFPWIGYDGSYMFISIPMWLTLMMGMFANLTLLMSVVAGWFLRRHAWAMCYLAACGLLAGVLMPIVGVAGGWADGNLSDMYRGLYAGYWLWIAALALHPIAWGSVARNQRHMRAAAIAHARGQLKEEPWSGESS